MRTRHSVYRVLVVAAIFPLSLSPSLSLSRSLSFARSSTAKRRWCKWAKHRYRTRHRTKGAFLGLWHSVGRLHFEFFVYAHFDRMQFDHWESRANHKSSNEWVPAHRIQCFGAWRGGSGAFQRVDFFHFIPRFFFLVCCYSKRGEANWEPLRHSQQHERHTA